MSRYTASLATLMASGALIVGCASTSDHAAGRTSTGPATSAAAPSAATTTARPTSTAPGLTTATSATLDYTPPFGKSPPVVHKTVTGATYQRLAGELAALKPVPPGTATCNVLTAEMATITVTGAGHTAFYIVEGSPCRGVRLSTDGVAQPLLAGSIALVNQIRAIAGTPGMVHPLRPS